MQSLRRCQYRYVGAKVGEPQPVTTDNRLPKIIELVSLTLDQPHFQSAATALATKLAVELSCSRVSIGFLRGRFITVRALSHSASHGVKTTLLRAIAEAMEEAIGQDTVLVCPDKGHVISPHTHGPRTGIQPSAVFRSSMTSGSSVP